MKYLYAIAYLVAAALNFGLYAALADFIINHDRATGFMIYGLGFLTLSLLIRGFDHEMKKIFPKKD